MAQAARQAGRRYVALDAMRGVAALLVVVLHSGRMLQGQWAPGGYLAVDLFFALSGFVIAHSYDERLAGGLGARRFVLLRAVRFWPLYVLGLALGTAHQVLLVATHNEHAMGITAVAAAAMLALIFLPDPVARNGNLFPLNVPSWSLFLELLANAGYALAFPRLGARTLATLAAAGGVAFALLCLRHGSADMGATSATLPSGIARTLFSFTTGVLIYRSGWRPFALPLPLLLALVAGLMVLPVAAAWRAWYDVAAVLLVSPLLVGIGAATLPGARLTKPSEAIGLVSYPVYAVHRPLIDLCTPALEKLHVPPLAAAVLFIGALVALGLLLERVDRRARALLGSLLGLRRERALPEASLP
jgi:peptidoglycan/LPS O-acetylase OafA/YrhL